MSTDDQSDWSEMRDFIMSERGDVLIIKLRGSIASRDAAALQENCEQVIVQRGFDVEGCIVLLKPRQPS